MTPAEIAALAAGLTGAQRRALLCFRAQWMTSGEAGATGMAATLLCTRNHPLAERRWTSWGPDRVNGQLRGEGYEYRLYPDGLAVRQHILAGEG